MKEIETKEIVDGTSVYDCLMQIVKNCDNYQELEEAEKNLKKTETEIMNLKNDIYCYKNNDEALGMYLPHEDKETENGNSDNIKFLELYDDIKNKKKDIDDLSISELILFNAMLNEEINRKLAILENIINSEQPSEE